jgi:hypothetical protein
LLKLYINLKTQDKKMLNFNRFTQMGGLTLLCTMALTNPILAQNANIDFTGSNPPQIIVELIINGSWNGSLGLDISTPSLIRVPATLILSGFSGLSFTITSITDNGSSLSGANYSDLDLVKAEIEDGATLIVQGETSPSGNYTISYPLNIPSSAQPAPVGSKSYKVALTMGEFNGSVLPLGNYQVRVTIGLTPQ